MRQEITIGSDNDGLETVLEQSIVALGKRGDLSHEWCRYCPVASGMIINHPGGRAAIDLLCIDNQHADFIELKYEEKGESKATPAYAAIQILCYGLVYLFSRDWKNQLIYKNNKGDCPFFY